VHDGLAVFVENPEDKRAALLQLTSKGAKTLKAIYALDQKWCRNLMKKLDAKELFAVSQCLKKIAEVFANELNRA
jgi:DNA-binding MarR family transcriptional regulator